jgi:hypothetical protein
MVQVPEATNVTVLPDIVHTAMAVDEKLTARSELAAAATEKGTSPKVLFGSAVKVIV